VPAYNSARQGSLAALRGRAPPSQRGAMGVRVRAHRPAAHAGRTLVNAGHGDGPLDRRLACAARSRDAPAQPSAAGPQAPGARGRPPAARRPAAPPRRPPRPRPPPPPGTPARRAQRPRPQRLAPAAGTRSPGARCASDGDNCRDAPARGCRRRAAQQRHCALHPHAWPRALQRGVCSSSILFGPSLWRFDAAGRLPGWVTGVLLCLLFPAAGL